MVNEIGFGVQENRRDAETQRECVTSTEFRLVEEVDARRRRLKVVGNACHSRQAQRERESAPISHVLGMMGRDPSPSGFCTRSNCWLFS